MFFSLYDIIYNNIRIFLFVWGISFLAIAMINIFLAIALILTNPIFLIYLIPLLNFYLLMRYEMKLQMSQ